MTVSVGVGAIRGTYAGEVRLTDQLRPKSYVMHASGAGAAGNARATVTLEPQPGDGATPPLTYSADAVVGGPVAGVGQRMMTGVAKRMAGQFFTAVEQELTAPVPAPNVVARVEPEPVPAGTPQAPVTAAPAAGWLPDEARPLLVGAAGGGLLTLLGVVVGWLLGRRRETHPGG